MSRTRVLIADDHAVVREGLRAALTVRKDIEVTDTVSDGKEAVARAQTLSPDIIIMDLGMPGMDGVAAAREIKKLSPGSQIIIYSMHADQEQIVELFEIGIAGYVLKDAPLEDLIGALETVRRGGTFYSSEVPLALSERLKIGAGKDQGADRLESLSARELEVFRLLADGRSVKSAGRALNISPKTVESHKYNIMEKLGVASVTELTKLAIKHKLIDV